MEERAVIDQLEREYRQASERYRKLGKRAKGTAHNSEAYLAYESAKHEYHRAGKALRNARNQSR